MKVFHTSFRIFFGWFLDRILSVAISEFSWIRRNSSTSKDGFNILFSDFDYSAIGPANHSQQLKEAKDKYFKIKLVFPWLGEPEFYTPIEKSELDEAMAHYGTEYSTVRHFRKAVWMYHRYRQSSSKYQKAKFLRSFTRSMSQLDCKVDCPSEFSFSVRFNQAFMFLTEKFRMALASDGVIQRFPEAIVTRPFYVPYLDIWFGPGHLDLNGVRIDKCESVELLSCLPQIYDEEDHTLVKIIQSFQKNNPKASACAKALTQIEAQVVRASLRGLKNEDDGLKTWLTRLEAKAMGLSSKT